jgi:hypothetical protein
VRASATSKISSAAHYAAAQAKSNDTKTDQASPFALLVDMVTTKDAVGGRPAQKDAADASDKGADDKTATVQDNQDTAPQTAASAPAQPKPEKSDKSSDKDEAKDKDKADPRASAADAQMQEPQVSQQTVIPADPQNVPPPPPVAQTAIAADGESDDLAVDAAAASAALKPQTDIKAPANGKPEAKPNLKAEPRTGTPVMAPVKAAATETPAVTDDSTDDDLPIAEPASQPAAPKAAAQAPTAAGIQTATAVDNKGKVAQNSDAKTTTAPQQDTAQSAVPQDPAPKDVAAETDTADAAPDKAGKTAGVKNTAPKSRTVQTDTTDEIAKSDQRKSDTSKAAAPQVDIPNAANPPKAAPHPASQAIFAINSIAAPQGAQSSPVASATANAHVQVSTHATPDLPALAVGIVAKSQSGAKQFDIRLDPPELGRVEVRLSIDATGKASAHLSADQPQTLHLLQKDAPVLTRALRDAGLDVSQDGLNFSLRQQGENASGNAGNNGRRGSSRGFPLSASVGIEATSGSAAYRAVANGRLDIRV